MSPEECREEALRRAREADRLFAEYEENPGVDPLVLAYNRIAHNRQMAAVYAALAK